MVNIISHIDKTSLLQNKGFFLVLLGPDGSGKTAISNGIIFFWQHRIKKKPLYIHGGFSILPRLRNLRIIWAKIRGRIIAPDIDFTRRHSGSSVKPHSALRSFLYLAYYIWDYVLGHLFIFWHKSKDKIIIADRYYYDYFFQLRNSRLPKMVLWFFYIFIPKPDLIVYLDRDPEQIYRMKDELTIEEIDRQQGILRNLVKKLPNAVTVDANHSINATVDRVLAEIYKIMAKRNQ